MAHFAELDQNNIVLRVIVVNNDVVNNLPFPESEPLGVAFCQSIFGDNTIWKQTSYNNNFRYQYAGIGAVYDAQLDAFLLPQIEPTPQMLEYQAVVDRTGVLPPASTETP